MTESVLPRPLSPSPDRDRPLVVTWIRRLVWKIAIATLMLMAVGSATRVMNAGLACPDWPLCYGQLIPRQQMNLQVFLEWFHRLDASFIGLSTIALFGLTLWFRRDLPKWVPWASALALGTIVFQGILGGLTVTQLLRFDIVTAHLATALVFLCTLIAIAIFLLPFRGTATSGKLTAVGAIAALAVFGQSLLGGLVGSRWAAHQCLSGAQLCTVMNSHLLGVVPATLSVIVTIVLAWRTPALHPLLRQLTAIAGGLVGMQILLGVATLRLHLQVEPLTVAHHVVAALLLGTLVAFTTLTVRDRLSDRSSYEPSLQS